MWIAQHDTLCDDATHDSRILPRIFNTNKPTFALPFIHLQVPPPPFTETMFCGPALRATLGHRAVTTATSALRSLALPRAVAVAAAATTSKWTTAVVGSSPCAGAGAAAVSKPAVRTMCAYVPPEGAVSVAQPAADAVRKLVGPDFKPAAGIVLGSGLGGVAEQVRSKTQRLST